MDVPLVMFVPIVFTVITAAWWAYWIATEVALYSYGYMYKSSNGPWANIDHTYDSSKTYTPTPGSSHPDLWWNCWYFLFNGLWVNAFLQSVCQFILAVRRFAPV